MRLSGRRPFAAGASIGILCIAILGLASPAGAGASSFAGPNGAVVWVELKFGSPFLDLFTARPDGSGVRQLTSGDFVEAAAAAPGGQSIAFVGNSARNLSLYAAGDASPRVLVAEADTVYGPPSWSSAGELFATVRHGTDPWELDRIGLDGSTVTVATGLKDPNVLYSPATDRVLAWDPATHLYTVSDPSAANAVTVGSGDFGGAWSPDGQRIALPGASSTITVVNADGSGSHSFQVGPCSYYNLIWSPDSSVIAWDCGAAHPDGSPAEKPVAPTVPNYQASQSRLDAWVTAGPGPTVTTANPTSIAQGTAKTITLYGTNFRAGVAVEATAGAQVSAVKVVNSKRLTFRLAVGAEISPSAIGLSVTNFDGSAVSCACLVIALRPRPSATSPSSVARGATTSVTLTGSGFVPGSKVSMQGVTITNVSTVAPDTITLTVTVAANGRPGVRTVRVQNPDGGSGSCDCFSVT
jgi:hypothetical protein